MLEPESLYHNNLSYRQFFNPYINVAVYRYLEFLKESCEPSKPVLLYYIGILVVRKEYNTGECDPPPENLPEGVKKGLHRLVQAFDIYLWMVKISSVLAGALRPSASWPSKYLRIRTVSSSTASISHLP